MNRLNFNNVDRYAFSHTYRVEMPKGAFGKLLTLDRENKHAGERTLRDTLAAFPTIDAVTYDQALGPNIYLTLLDVDDNGETWGDILFTLSTYVGEFAPA
jgi:hypothetical protein